MTAATTRVPLVAGIDAGVGTSTLAAALHARDGGVLAQQADVVVCAATEESLRAAATVACPGTGPRPVLVVTGGPPAVPVPPAVRTRYCAVVDLPRIDDRAAGPPAADVLGVPADQLGAPLRAYADALRTLVSALLGGGVLAGSSPPMVIRPRVAEPRRGTPRSAPHPVRPSPTAAPSPTTPPPPTPPPPPPAPETTGRHRAAAPLPPPVDESRSRPIRPDDTRSRPARRDESRSRTDGGGGGRADRQAGPARTTRPPRRLTDVRSTPGRPRRTAHDEDDEAIEARNAAADRRAAPGRAG